MNLTYKNNYYWIYKQWILRNLFNKYYLKYILKNYRLHDPIMKYKWYYEIYQKIN